MDIMIFLLLLGISKGSVFSHENSKCLSIYKGDLICDIGCMNYENSFDSPKDMSLSVFELFNASDCYFNCTAGNCNYANLLAEYKNGDCDGKCNTKECGWVLGKCGFCEAGCTEAMLKNSKLDPPCDTDSCFFDNNQGGWCAKDCKYEDLTSEVKVSACNNKNCSYQNGKFLEPVPNCKCNKLQMENGICDEECDNEECNYDGQECICAEKCTTVELYSGNCDTSSPCFKKSCNFMGCQSESKCQPYMLGDGNCDHECNSEDFEYDRGDCQCAKNCPMMFADGKWTGTAKPCQDECMVESCMFSTYNCDDTYKLEIAVLTTLLYKSYDKTYTIKYTDECSFEILKNFTKNNKCDSKHPCNVKEFLFCRGFSENNEMYCDRYGESGCLINSKNSYTRRNSINYPDLAKLYSTVNQNINDIFNASFYWTKEGSFNKNSPLTFEIQPNDTHDLYFAFVNSIAPYVKIIVKSGDHDYKQPINPNYISGKIDEKKPLSYIYDDVTQYELTIEGEGEIKPNIYIEKDVLFDTKFLKFNLKNINFNGKKILNSSCTDESCEYCWAVIEQSNGKFRNDKYIEVDNKPYCKDIDDIIFTLKEGALSISDCKFSNFRHQPDAFIETTSTLTIKNTIFEKTQPKSKKSVISIKCIQNNCEDITLTMENVTITDLNYGYEHTSKVNQGYFLMAENIGDILLQKLHFSYGMSISCSDCYGSKVMLFKKIQGSITIKDSTFENLYIQELIRVTTSELSYNKIDEYDMYGYKRVLNMIHLNINNCNFTNIYSQDGLITYEMANIKHNINMNNLRFDSIVTMKKGILFIKSSNTPTQNECEGGRKSYVNLAYNRTFELEKPLFIKISNCFLNSIITGLAVIHIESYPNIKIENFNLDYARTPTKSDPYEFSIKNFKKANKYLSMFPSSSLFENSELESIFYLHNINYAIFSNLNIKNISSVSTTFSIIYANIVKNNITITTYSLANIKTNSTMAIAAELIQSESFFGLDFNFEDLENSDENIINIDDASLIELKNIKMERISTTFSAAISITQGKNITFSNFSVNSLKAFDSKSALIFIEMSSRSEQVIISDFNLNSINNHHGQGLVLYLDSVASTSYISFFITKISIENSSSLDSFFYFSSNLNFGKSDINAISIKNSTCENNGLITDLHYQGQLKIKNLLISEVNAFVCSVLGKYRVDLILLEITDSIIEKSTCRSEALSLEGNKKSQINLSNITFTEVKSDLNTISVNKANVNSSQLFISDISKGSVLFLINSQFYMASSSLTRIKKESVLMIESYFECDDCIFNELEETAIRCSQQSAFKISNSIFRDSESEKSIILQMSNGKIDTISVFESCKILNCSSDQNLMLVENSKISLIDTKIKENPMKSISYLKISNSLLNVINSSIKNISSTFLEASVSSTVNYTNSSFIGNLLLSQQNLSLEEMREFLQNQDISFEGAAARLKDSSITVTGCFFSHLFSKTGSVISSESSPVTFSSSTITSCASSLDFSSIIKVLDASLSVFSSNFSSSLTSSAFLQVIDSSLVVISESSFSNNQYCKGGAVTISGNQDSNTTIKNSQFIENQAEDSGGGLHILDTNLYIYSSTFSKNSAKLKGGGIYFEYKKCLSCVFLIYDGTVFKENSCTEGSGGAIKWMNTKPVEHGKVIYSKNSAKYGNDQAAYPVSLTSKTGRKLADINGFKPGDTMTDAIEICMTDVNGNITDDQEFKDLTGTLSSNSNNVTISGTSSFPFIAGCFNITDFVLKGEPGTSINLLFSCPDLKKIAESNGISQNETIKYELEISVEFRECSLGEKELSNECVSCENGKYLIQPAETCINCPNGAECLGGYLVLPKAGYWKTDYLSDNVLKCPVEEACLGSRNLTNELKTDVTKVNNEVTDFSGTCKDGYFGHLCASCLVGYSKSSDGKCSKCPSGAINAIILISILFGMSLISVIMVKSTLKSAFSTSSLHSIYIKIFTNYLQIIFLTTQFNLDWPVYVLQLFSIQKAAASSSDQLYSIDCFFNENSNYSKEDVYKIKLLIATALPLFIWLISFLVWFFISLLNETYSYLKREFFTTMIVLFFLIHPNLIKTIFSSFSCRRIDNIGLWLVDELEIQCWTSFHSKVSLTISFPSLVIWGFTVPSCVLITMIKRRRYLNKDQNKVIFGFIYNGFKQSKFYWEFVILNRKILIIVISVFMSQGSTMIQALTVIIVLILSVYLQDSQRPFNCKQLNSMEVQALLTASVTIYCGMFYLSGGIDEFVKTSLFIAILTGNLFFLCYWIYYMVKAVVDIFVGIFPYLRKIFKKGDYFDEEPFREIMKTQGVYVDTVSNEKKYTFFKGKNKSLQNILEGVNNMQELFKESLKYRHMLHSKRDSGSSIHLYEDNYSK